jgi:hypothetical protein
MACDRAAMPLPRSSEIRLSPKAERLFAALSNSPPGPKPDNCYRSITLAGTAGRTQGFFDGIHCTLKSAASRLLGSDAFSASET